MIKIVLFSGGTGSIAIQKGFAALYGYDNYRMDVVINAYDNGKSTGACRKVFDGKILGPSDLRKNQLTQYELTYGKEIEEKNSYEAKLLNLFELRFDGQDHARVRYIGTDFARTGRQRTVISKCLDKVKKMGLGEISSLAEDFLPRVRTDLTEGDCAALLLMALNLNDYAFESLAVPVDGSWNSANINGMSVLTINFSENAKAWHDLVDGGNAD